MAAAQTRGCESMRLLIILILSSLCQTAAAFPKAPQPKLICDAPRPLALPRPVVAVHEVPLETGLKRRAIRNLHRGSPLIAKSASMGLTYGLADITAQVFALVVDGKTVPLADAVRRSVSLTAVGLLAVGPLLTVWFDYLERLFPGSSKRAVVGRTLMDQVVQAPFMIALIFTLSSLAEGHGLAFCAEKVNTKLYSTWVSCLGVWAPAQLLNQGVLPLKYRVYFQAVLSFFWDAYMSIVSHSVQPVRVKF